ncbi:MAG: iron ABC transporter permease [bacterium]|nr:iron ABC transporter permease [bacterium]
MNKKYTAIPVIGLALLLLLPFIGIVDLDILALAGDNPDSFIFWQLRVPRTLLAFMVGSILALAGFMFQNIFKNSLATPYTLGVSSGAAAATVTAIKLNLTITFLGLNGIFFYGFCGAAITIFIILGIARMVKSFSIYTLLMSGIALNFFFSAFILLIQYLLDFTETVSVLRWLMGGLAVSGYSEIIFLLPIYLFFAASAFLFKSELMLISGGDEFAYSKGINVKKFRIFIFILVSFVVGVAVSMAGPIGFVGLIVPHISRLIFKNRINLVIYFTLFFGGFLLVFTDFLARTLIPPVEIPVGIITSFLGAPFFLFILVSRLKKE